VGEAVVRTCICCDGTGLDTRYDVPQPGRCPVCGGKGRTAHRWEGDEFVVLDPDEVEAEA
jgi:DnaJ-class molecular chaperone